MVTENRHREILGLLILVFALLILLSLMSYHVGDYHLLRQGQSVNNIIGPIGVGISHFLRMAFGYSSYCIVAILAIAGWNFLRGGDSINEIERILSISYFLLTSSSLISLIFRETVSQYSGGIIGLYLSGMIVSCAGKVGASILLIILNVIGFILLGNMSLSLFFHEEGQSWISRFRSKLRQFFIRIRGQVPFNRIDREIRPEFREKLPWITKERIPVEERNDRDRASLEDSMLLIEDHHQPAVVFPDEPVDDIESGEVFDIAYVSDGDRYETVASAEDCKIDRDESPEPEGIVYEGIAVNRIRSIEREVKVAPPLVAEADRENGDDSDAFDGGDVVDDFEADNDEAPARFEHIGGESRVFDEIKINSEYSIPTSYLKSSASSDVEGWKNEIRRNSELLVSTLSEFGIESRISKVNRGPVITLYEMQIAPGIKVNRIVSLADDIAMALAASRVRVVAPIPGKSAVGVEVPNRNREMVTLGDIIKSPEYQNQYGMLKVALGKDILGLPIVIDLKKMPHLLIAGATGSGKSVLVNSIIMSLVYNYDPNFVRFILVDPKMVELQLYNGLPHLLTPVITEPHVAPKALKWTMFEMERRYRLLSELHTRDIDRYNEKIEDFDDEYEKLPYIVIIMDELADLMMIASKEIEGFITRIAQKARAVGIHLVLATQRPSVDIITGIIKANFPARVAFQVPQKTDSRTIIDQNGAEKLLGKGDMLYQSPLSSFPVRIQGAFISEDEVMVVVNHLRKMGKPSYIDIEESIYEEEMYEDVDSMEDELFTEAMKIVEETKKASASYLQRRLSIGYNRAARIIELMEDRGYVGPQQGSKPREVFI